MKKTMNYLFGASLLTLIATTGPAAAQTCVNAPTCAELGYTLTSTTTCAGTPLKCPFDKTKYNCVQKTDIYTTVMPNYTRRYELPINTNHTVGSGALAAYKCVWVLFYTGGTSISRDEYSAWYINGNTVGASSVEEGIDYNSAMYPVYTGDMFQLVGHTTNNNDHLFYYPCK